MKLVKNSFQINATQTLITLDQYGDPRPAVTYGGRWSRTGLTGDPTFVEEGSFPILRKREFIQELLYPMHNPGAERQDPAPFFFEGHGAENYTIYPADIGRYKTALAAWLAFRRSGELEPFVFDDPVGRDARHFTLDRFRTSGHLTAYEAEELLPRLSTWAVLEMETDQPDWEERTVWIHSAMGSASRTGTTGAYVFTREGETCVWESGGYTYRNVYSAKEQRWYKTRWIEGVSGSLEYEIEEDSGEWTSEPTEVKD